MGKLDWKKLVGTVAPTLATALGGPLAGVAVSTISKAVLGKETATEGELETALAGNTDALLKLKEAEQTFKLEMEKLGVDLERVHQADRDSARRMQIATKDFMPALLGITITVGFFGVLGYLMARGLPENGAQPVLILLGSLSTAWTAVTAFYYGSTKGSAEKTRLLAESQPGAPK